MLAIFQPLWIVFIPLGMSKSIINGFLSLSELNIFNASKRSNKKSAVENAEVMKVRIYIRFLQEDNGASFFRAIVQSF